MGPPPASGPFFSFVLSIFENRNISCCVNVFLFTSTCLALLHPVVVIVVGIRSGIGGKRGRIHCAAYNVVCSKKPRRICTTMTYTCHAVKKEKRESESGNNCCTCIRLCDPISTWRIVSRPSLPVGSSTARESALLHGGLHTRERVGAAKERKKKG